MAEPFAALDPDQQLGYLLARAAHQVSQTWTAALRRHGISPRQFSMLAVIAQAPGLSQGELARRVLISPQSVSESVSKLIDGALISRDKSDPGGPAELRLTERARKLLRRAYPVVEAANGHGFAALDRTEQAHLRHLLAKVIASG